MEEWKVIKDFEKYEISTKGRVRRIDTQFILKQNSDWCGYLQVKLRDDNGKGRKQRIHRLVAQAFIPNPNNLPQVDHINHCKTDNSVENLRWLSALENSSKNGNPNSRVVEPGIFRTMYNKANRYGDYMVKRRSAEKGYSFIVKTRTLEQARKLSKFIEEF